MSVMSPQPMADRHSPGLTINPSIPIATNNPFRRASNSPALHSSASSSPRPRSSRNPFLDRPDMSATAAAPSSSSAAAPVARTDSPVKPASPHETASSMRDLSLQDRPKDENTAPLGTRSMQPPRSQDGPVRRPIKPRGPSDRDVFAGARPPHSPRSRDAPGSGRPRRNSESSVVDTEEGRRRQERRQRDREHVPRDAKGRPVPRSGPHPKKPSRRLDVIDKLDVTSIFGTGVFHHDGPFDACNPHRNRKGSTRAPMQAFPKDSANNVLGGSGPVNKNIDIAQFHGHQADSFHDFSAHAAPNTSARVPSPSYEPYAGAAAPNRGDTRPGVDRTGSFNPGARQHLHGDETLGLGTSTFLEGAPAARIAIERRESDTVEALNGNSLARKKSLAQKIRGMSNARAPSTRFGTVGRGSPTERGLARADTVGANSQSAGGAERLQDRNNPFFEDYDKAYDAKGARIQAAAVGGDGDEVSAESAAAEQQMMRSPRDGMMRRATEGAIPSPVMRESTSRSNLAAPTERMNSTSGGSSGFLNRVKSLRGGSKNKARIRAAD